MAPTTTRPSARTITLLVVGMLVTGASNSLLSKEQNRICIGHCAPGERAEHFEQPVIQTLNMFLGETLCLLVFLVMARVSNPRRTRAVAAAKSAAEASRLASDRSDPQSRADESAIQFNHSDISLHDENSYDSAGEQPDDAGTAIAGWKKAALFWLPSTFDIIGTTLMNIGLLFLPVSVYQMLRGCLVLWVAAFSIIFLKRKLVLYQWTALAIVVAGVAIVGYSSINGESAPLRMLSFADPDAGSTLFGIVMVLSAQIFTASQFVIEEGIMGRYAVEPLAAVGYEGLFGTLTTLAIMPIGYLLVGRTEAGQGGYFDTVEGFHQMFSNPGILVTSVAVACSIAIFNFCGLGVTKSVSATARSTIDTCRTVLIWAVSLFLGWETYKTLQVVGFAVLVYGTLIFNDIMRFPLWTGLHKSDPVAPIRIESDDDEAHGVRAPLLSSE